MLDTIIYFFELSLYAFVACMGLYYVHKISHLIWIAEVTTVIIAIFDYFAAVGIPLSEPSALLVALILFPIFCIGLKMLVISLEYL